MNTGRGPTSSATLARPPTASLARPTPALTISLTE